MIAARLRTAGLCAVLALGLAACAERVDGTPVSGSTVRPSSPGSTSGDTVPASFPRDLSSLASRVTDALRKTTSVHLIMNLEVKARTLSTTVTGQGDQTVQDGASKDSSLLLNVGQLGSEKIVIAGGKGYVLLPAKLRTSNKPWALIRADSANTFVAALASLVDPANPPGPSAAEKLIRAADTLDISGASTLPDGTQVVTYQLDIATSRLSADNPLKQKLSAAHISHLPFVLSIDATDHIRSLVETVDVSTKLTGKISTITKVEMSDYDAPVSISPPPASQVSTR